MQNNLNFVHLQMGSFLHTGLLIFRNFSSATVFGQNYMLMAVSLDQKRKMLQIVLMECLLRGIYQSDLRCYRISSGGAY